VQRLGQKPLQPQPIPGAHRPPLLREVVGHPAVDDDLPGTRRLQRLTGIVDEPAGGPGALGNPRNGGIGNRRGRLRGKRPHRVGEEHQARPSAKGREQCLGGPVGLRRDHQPVAGEPHHRAVANRLQTQPVVGQRRLEPGTEPFGKPPRRPRLPRHGKGQIGDVTFKRADLAKELLSKIARGNNQGSGDLPGTDRKAAEPLVGEHGINANAGGTGAERPSSQRAVGRNHRRLRHPHHHRIARNRGERLGDDPVEQHAIVPRPGDAGEAEGGWIITGQQPRRGRCPRPSRLTGAIDGHLDQNCRHHRTRLADRRGEPIDQRRPEESLGNHRGLDPTESRDRQRGQPPSQPLTDTNRTGDGGRHDSTGRGHRGELSPPGNHQPPGEPGERGHAGRAASGDVADHGFSSARLPSMSSRTGPTRRAIDSAWVTTTSIPPDSTAISTSRSVIPAAVRESS